MLFIGLLIIYAFFEFLGHLDVKEDSTCKSGLATVLQLKCNSCDRTIPIQTSNSVTQRGTYDVNRRAVLYAVETGVGYEGLTEVKAWLLTWTLKVPIFQRF